MKKSENTFTAVVDQDDKRTLRRMQRLDPLFTASFAIADVVYRGMIVDLDPLGLSVEYGTPVPTDLIKKDLAIQNLSISYGNLELSKIDTARVAHLTKDAKRIGIDLNRVGERGRRTQERFKINDHLTPMLMSQDVLSINEKYIFKVQNLSVGGAQLSTSASNKNILPGLEIKDVQLFLPGFGMYTCSGKISNIRYDSGRLMCGISWQNNSKDFNSAVHQFIIMGADNKERENLISDIKNAKISTKTLFQSVRIQKVSTQEQYEEMLKLRYEAYKAASKVPDGWTYENFADEYDKHSLQYIVTVNDFVVGTFRLTYAESSDQKFPFEEKEPFTDKIGFARSDVFEVNKLAVMPELQKSDLVISIFRKVGEEGVKQKKALVIFSTKALRKMYRRLGAVQVSGETPHPTIKNESLAVLVLPVSSYLEGKGMAGISWDLLSKPVIEYFNRFGIKTVSLFNPKQKLKYFAESIFLSLKNKRRK